jgi:hypothetical protein
VSLTKTAVLVAEEGILLPPGPEEVPWLAERQEEVEVGVRSQT